MGIIMFQVIKCMMIMIQITFQIHSQVKIKEHKNCKTHTHPSVGKLGLSPRTFLVSKGRKKPILWRWAGTAIPTLQEAPILGRQVRGY